MSDKKRTVSLLPLTNQSTSIHGCGRIPGYSFHPSTTHLYMLAFFAPDVTSFSAATQPVLEKRRPTWEGITSGGRSKSTTVSAANILISKTPLDDLAGFPKNPAARSGEAAGSQPLLGRVNMVTGLRVSGRDTVDHVHLIRSVDPSGWESPPWTGR